MKAKKLVNLVINVEEDRQFYVNRIAFSGNTTTRDKVIRREVMVEEGNVFNSAAVGHEPAETEPARIFRRDRNRKMRK